MEESVKKFKEFLNYIYQAQTKADEYRVKVCSVVGGKRKIFFAIDKQFNNSITSSDICNFCKQRGMIIRQQDQQILGRYFRNWNKGINFQQFLEIMKPKTMYNKIQQNQFIDGINIFLEMLDIVIKSFKKLQILRQNIQIYFNFIINYFYQKYQIKQYLSKQNIKNFMIDQNIYSEQKYQQICNYIYGDNQIQIQWINIFGLNNSQIQLQQINLKNSYSIQSNQKYSQNQNIFNIQTNLIQKQECKNINDIIAQIQQMEKQMKQKRLKCNRCQPISQPRSQSISQPISPIKSIKQLPIKIISQKQSFIGKVIPQKNIPNKIKSNSTKFQHQMQQLQQQYDYKSKYTYEQNLYQLPNSKYFTKTKTTNIKSRNLNSINSQAQLKIQQIQKRAMDKYLSSRRDYYLPNDHHIPYFYNKKEPLQFIRQRSLENLSKTNSFNHEINYQPIFTRNKASRLLYADGALMQRPVSPRLLRY